MLIDIKPGTELTVELPNQTRLIIECEDEDCIVTHWSKEYTTPKGIKMRTILNQFIQSELQIS